MLKYPRRESGRRLSRAFAGLASAFLVAGCFQPLYGDRAPGGGSTVRQMLSGVEIDPISAPANTPEARLAVQIQNELRFNVTGGTTPPRSTHRLTVRISGGRQVLSATNVTGLPIIENFVLNATYVLTEIGTGRAVVNGRATTTVTYDPAGTQRFARIAGMQDAERRAAKVIADNVTTRLASFFVSGS